MKTIAGVDDLLPKAQGRMAGVIRGENTMLYNNFQWEIKKCTEGLILFHKLLFSIIVYFAYAEIKKSFLFQLNIPSSPHLFLFSSIFLHGKRTFMHYKY